MQIILASQSPRRQELLRQIGITDFITRPAKGREYLDPDLSPSQTVCALAQQKAQEILPTTATHDLVIAADTVVALEGQIFGKPADARDAARMLRVLSGREHQVYTGVTLATRERISTRYAMTAVQFRSLTEDEITRYIATGEPMDKAGSYAIQGLGSIFVQRIAGDYFNVVGLPLCLLAEMLAEFGIPLCAEAALRNEDCG